jgi:hypothetical protein
MTEPSLTSAREQRCCPDCGVNDVHGSYIWPIRPKLRIGQEKSRLDAGDVFLQQHSLVVSWSVGRQEKAY